MAKEKNKTVPVKFAASTVFNGKIHPKDSVIEVSEDEALALIEREHATEHTPSQPQQQQQQSPVASDAELLAQFDGLSKAELEKVLAKSKSIKEGAAAYAEAQSVIRLVTDLLKK